MSEDGDFTPENRELMNAMLEHGILFPPEFKDRLREWILDALRDMPRKQIPGANLLQVRDAHFGGGLLFTGTPGMNYESVDVLIPGREKQIVRGLADGRYLIWYTGAPGIGTDNYHMNISVNGDVVSPSSGDPTSIEGRDPGTWHSRPRLVTLNNGDNNTVEMVLRIDGSGAGSSDTSRVLLIRLGPVN